MLPGPILTDEPGFSPFQFRTDEILSSSIITAIPSTSSTDTTLRSRMENAFAASHEILNFPDSQQIASPLFVIDR
jgi:hypothetical protein